MLTIQSLREEKEQIANALDKRHIDARKELDQILQWDTERRSTQAQLDDILAQRSRGHQAKNGIFQRRVRFAKGANASDRKTDARSAVHDSKCTA